jgi:hypothetical protein
MLVDFIGFFPFIILFVFYLFVKFHPQKPHDSADRMDEGSVMPPVSGERLSTANNEDSNKTSAGV